MAEKRKMHPNSLANLQAPFSGNDDPRCQKSHMPEACAKRSESMKKNAEEKEAVETFQRIVKRIGNQKAPDSIISKLDLAEFLTEEELKNMSNRELAHLRLQMMSYFEQNPITMIKILEYWRDTSGEKPVEETVIKQSTKGQSTVTALLSEIKKMNKKEDD